MKHTRSLNQKEILVLLAASVLLIAASFFHWWPLPLIEVLGFVTGGICVWLTVRENIWNWPIGLANNVFFFFLFLRSRLFADLGLQIVYFGLGIYGWLNWCYGGDKKTELRISRALSWEWKMFALLIPAGTWGLRELLLLAGGAAPFQDALTTVLSLAAQYLLSRKRLENWWLWIAADIIYIPLYLNRRLPLTAVLYAIFLVMCIIGLRRWRQSWHTMQTRQERQLA